MQRMWNHLWHSSHCTQFTVESVGLRHATAEHSSQSDEFFGFLQLSEDAGGLGCFLFLLLPISSGDYTLQHTNISMFRGVKNLLTLSLFLRSSSS